MTAAVEFRATDRGLELVSGTCVRVTAGSVTTDGEPSVFGSCRVGSAGIIAYITCFIDIGGSYRQVTAVITVDVEYLVFTSAYYNQRSVVTACNIFAS